MKDIIIAPVITEKSQIAIGNNVYTFKVSKDANKTQIKQAIEEAFGVKVKEVRTTYNTRKKYEPGNVKDLKNSSVNIVSLKEVYHQNSNLTDFQKVVKNIKKDGK